MQPQRFGGPAIEPATTAQRNPWWLRLFPFLEWLPLARLHWRADLVAGVTVAMILVPQSMAYASLAGLPVVYGLYAAFIPVIVASLWGSLRQLHTGPTAMLALLSFAAVLPHAAAGSPEFIEVSIVLALVVGVLRLVLGLARLGAIVNLLSAPVVVGFTNAAALIIGLSQVNKLLGVPMPRSDSFVADVWLVVTQLGTTHLPTLAFAIGSFALIYALQRYAPRAPAILIAMIVSIVVAWAGGFERQVQVPLQAIGDDDVRRRIAEYASLEADIAALRADIARLNAQARALPAHERFELQARIEQTQARLRAAQQRARDQRVDLHAAALARNDAGATPQFVPAVGAGRLTPVWRFDGVAGGAVRLRAGGEVVGTIPAGLPAPSVPRPDFALVAELLPLAFVLALLGFMEATSITQAIVAKTRQRVDISRELVGQGLANIVGSFFQAFVVSGSFSRSAVAARAGAQTGMFAIVSALGVVIVMLLLTPLLYHLPQAVLAVIVMFAVFGLIRVRPLVDAWRVDRTDAAIGVTTFVTTLAAAPSLAYGIAIGVVLSVVAFLLRNMRPRAEILGRHADGRLVGVERHGVAPLGQAFVALRFDGSLNFVTANHFEQAVLEALARVPQARAVLVVGGGINDIDATGAEKVRALAQRLAEVGVGLHFSSLKHQVRHVFDLPLMQSALPPSHLHATKEGAIASLQRSGLAGLP